MYYIGETLMLAVFSYAAIYFWGPCPFAGKNGCRRLFPFSLITKSKLNIEIKITGKVFCI
jgi:hypothetical protein